MKRIALIHFQAVELYPPVLNDINFLNTRLENTSLHAYSTVSNTAVFKFEVSGNATIHRFGNSSINRTAVKRYWTYLVFNLCTTLSLILSRPSVVLYFETISAFPALIYKRFINKRASLMAHYHEYSSKKEYEQGMLLNRLLHKWEVKSYSKCDWISHTIRQRLELFVKDYPSVAFKNLQLLPNYPPRSWKRSKLNTVRHPLKVVMLGTLSSETMYLKEFAEWINFQNGKIVWDIYSLYFEPAALKYLQQLNSPYIKLKPGINYFQAPEVLSLYDIGVILYKGSMPNYRYNAPNKLFEYLAVGLDVWFPDVMTGSLPFQTRDVYPQVTALDFNGLFDINVDELVDKEKLSYKEPVFYCEEVLNALLRTIERTS